MLTKKKIRYYDLNLLLLTDNKTDRMASLRTKTRQRDYLLHSLNTTENTGWYENIVMHWVEFEEMKRILNYQSIHMLKTNHFYK